MAGPRVAPEALVQQLIRDFFIMTRKGGTLRRSQALRLLIHDVYAQGAAAERSACALNVDAPVSID